MHELAATELCITSFEIKSIDFRSSSANNSIAGGFTVCAIQVLMNGGVRLKSYAGQSSKPELLPLMNSVAGGDAQLYLLT